MTPNAPAHASALNTSPYTLGFITGCGRSGTTILGRIIEAHPDVCYLNDRHDLWVRSFPITDAWGDVPDAPIEADARASIALDHRHALAVDPAGIERFHSVVEWFRQQRPAVVEKLPLNNFRLRFLRTLWPHARLINIVRHGVEVAFSIAARAEAGQWYGPGDRKWRLLAQHAREVGLGHLADACHTPYDRGLLEWRLSVEAAQRDLQSWPEPRVLSLRYEDLLSQPVDVARRLQRFLDIEPNPAVERFAACEVARQNPAANERTIPPSTGRLAGDLLRSLGYHW